MRKEACILDHVADSTPQPDQVPGGRGNTLDRDLAGAWQEQAIHHFQGGGLARPATTQEHQGLAGIHIETEIVQNSLSDRCEPKLDERRPEDSRASRSHDPQVFVNELHRHRSLPHCRGHPLGGAESHVARREDAGTAGLEEERFPICRPVR